jgi:HlyD family secretion protein
MKPIPVLLAVAAVAAGAVAAWRFLPGDRGPAPFLGYVEADTMLIAPKQTGRLVSVMPEEGDEVAAGAALFALDADDERAAIAEASARLEQARAQLEDLRAARQRPAEIEALQAQRESARATVDFSRSELERYDRLFKRGVSSEARLDQARTAFRRDSSTLSEIERQIEAARLPAREHAIAAAESAVAAGNAALQRAQISLAERSVAAPRAGRVLDVIYRPGEIVPSGQPVLEILPPENVKVRFYVPETAVSGIRQGTTVAIACDACPPGLDGTVSYVASRSEFTPPVIFSRQERAKLVFLVEAKPTGAAPPTALRPGLPVEVRVR